MRRATPSLASLACGLSLIAPLSSTRADPDPTAAAAAAVPSTADQIASANTGLEEVVVTARKRDERLLDLPMAVTAFTERRLEASDIRNIQDIANFTPGVSLSSNGGAHADRSYQTLIIRGLTPQGQNTPGKEDTATIFIDGVPVSGGFIEGLDDVSRVEVIKGPQSAYFGRRTFAGAVNIITKDPPAEWSGRASVEIGSYELHDVRAAVGGPIVKDVLSFRIFGRDYDQGGMYDNAGYPKEDLGAQHTRSIGASLLFTPTDELRVKLFGIYWNDSDGPPANAKFGKAQFNCNAGAAPKNVFNYVCGQLPDVPDSRVGLITPIDPLFQSTILQNSLGILRPIFSSDEIDHPGIERKAYHINASVSYEIAALDATVTSLTGLNEDRMWGINDLGLSPTVTPNSLFGVVPNAPSIVEWLFNEQWYYYDRSEEIRIASDSRQRWRWLLGFNYEYTDRQLSDSALTPFGPLIFLDGRDKLESTTYGVFGSLGVDITDQVSLDFEGRYQSDKKSALSHNPVGGNAVSNFGVTFRNFVPRVILKYKPTEETQVYFNYAQGVSPGNYNLRLLSAAPVQLAAVSQYGITSPIVQPETLDNYEIGFKGKFFQNRLDVSLSAYYATWSDQIVSSNFAVPQVDGAGKPVGGNTLFTLQSNIGETELKGVELDLNYAPDENWLLSFSGAYNDTNIRKFTCAVCALLTGSTDVNGNQLGSYSKYSALVSVEYNQPLTDALDGYARVDYIYKSRMYESEANIAYTPDQNRINLRVGIRTGAWKLEGFILNLTDDRAYTSIENNLDVLSPGFSTRSVNVGLAPKRQFGLRAQYDF